MTCHFFRTSCRCRADPIAQRRSVPPMARTPTETATRLRKGRRAGTTRVGGTGRGHEWLSTDRPCRLEQSFPQRLLAAALPLEKMRLWQRKLLPAGCGESDCALGSAFDSPKPNGDEIPL